MTTERLIARAIAAGTLPSPTEFLGSQFYRVRFSGTGVAWRARNEEFCYRPPQVWLSDDMCARVCGVPLVAEHPAKQQLDGEAFYDSIVGVCVYGFVEGTNLMAIARVIDKHACAIIDAGRYDTSPAVLFEPTSGVRLDVDGDRFFVEDVPALLDHLALVDTSDGNKGVWTRGAEPGVDIDQPTTN